MSSLINLYVKIKAHNIFIYRSERDIRQIQPDQKLYTNYTNGQKNYTTGPKTKNMFRIKGKLLFVFPNSVSLEGSNSG